MIIEFSNRVAIIHEMLCLFMVNWISCNLYITSIISIQRSCCAWENPSSVRWSHNHIIFEQAADTARYFACMNLLTVLTAKEIFWTGDSYIYIRLPTSFRLRVGSSRRSPSSRRYLRLASMEVSIGFALLSLESWTRSLIYFCWFKMKFFNLIIYL